MRKGILSGLLAGALIFTAACEELDEPLPKGNEIPAATETGSEESEVEPESEPEAEREIKKFVINKGEQHSTLSYEIAELTELKFRALFDSSAIYETTLAENQGDINKLYGVSDCNSYHHTNSARFGWRWYNKKLEIWAYTYDNGERRSEFIDTVPFGTFSEYQISFSDGKYLFHLNEKTVEMPRFCSGPSKGYKLFPYFGGDEASPHEIRIWIEDLID